MNFLVKCPFFCHVTVVVIYCKSLFALQVWDNNFEILTVLKF